jgi:hypothetical protein
VARVNALCADLMPKVLGATGGGHPESFPIKAFNAERPKVRDLMKAFDEQVDAIPVAAADRSAANAFDAFRRLSDTADTRLAAAAATGKQDSFDAAFDATGRTFGSGSALRDFAAAGIRCPAR